MKERRKRCIRNKAEQHREINGITLVALVVTIVVLIILATISVGALFGEKGIIKQAKEAKEAHENGRNEEEKSLDDLMTEYNKVKDELASGNGGGSTELPDITPTTPAGTQVKKPNTWTSEKVTAIADGKGGLVPLPDGYYYVGGDIDTGLVISDKAGDTMDASGVDMRKPICVDTCAR